MLAARNFESRVYTVPPPRLRVMNYMHNSPQIIKIIISIQYFFKKLDSVMIS